MLLGISLLIANLFFTGTAIGQTYYYKGTGALNSTANWGLNTDGSSTAPSNFTTAGRTFNVRNVASVSNSGTWTVSGAGSKIVVGDGTNACNVTIPTGTNTIVGTIDVSAAATLTLTNTTLPTLGTLNAASTVVYNGSGAQAISAITYGNLTYSGSSTGTFANSLTIAGNLLISSGNVTLAAGNRIININGNFTISTTGTVDLQATNNRTTTVNLDGNFTKSNGTLTTSANANNGVINFSGTSQSIICNNTDWTDFIILSGSTCTLTGAFVLNASTTSSMTVNAGGALNCGTNILSGGTGTDFTLNSGGSLLIGATAGITAAGTNTGNIQTATRSFNVGGNYSYNGVANQIIGTGFPSNLTGSLTIDNIGNTVTLSAAKTIANGGIVNLTNGIFATANILTMASTSTINRSGGTTSGTPQGAGIYNVNYTGNSKTTGTELDGTGLNNVNENLTSGQTLTLGNAITMDGALTIASGTTMDVSGSNFAINIAGSWTNNSGTFTSGTGTVTFNGTGAQSINGTAASQTFNNVIVNKTAATLLNTGGSTTTITTNQLTLTQGNFTAPATLNINGNFTHTAGTFTAGANTNVAANWTRNGGTFTAGTNTVTFTGSSAQIINGSNSTAFYTLTINKTTGANTVTNPTTAFSSTNAVNVTQGNLVLTAANGNYSVLDLTVSTNGKLSHNVDWSTNFLLAVAGNLAIDGTYEYVTGGSPARAHVQMTGTGKTVRTGTTALSIFTIVGGSVTANGTVTANDNFWAPIGSGSFTTGTNTINANASFLISGGTTTVNGGTLNVIGGISLGANSVAGILTYTSGSIVTDAIQIGDGAATTTGTGTITQSAGTNLVVNGGVTISQQQATATNAWNINAGTATVSGLITFAGASATANRIGKIAITTGTLNANGGITFVTSASANKVIDMSAGASTVNLKGSLTVPATSSTLTSSTTSIFNYNDNVSAQTVNYFSAGAYSNLNINTTGGIGAILSAPVTATNVTGNLRVQSGTLKNGGFAIAGVSGKTFEVANGATFILSGTTSAFPTVFTSLLGATGTVNYAGSGAQIVSAQSYGNLTTSNSGSLTMTGNSSVATTLTFTSGKITTGGNTLTLASGASISGAGTGKYVFGNLAWTFPTGTPTRTFEIGDASNYTPATVAFTTAITTGGILTAFTSAGDHPNIATSGLDASKSVNRTWTLTNGTISPVAYSATFNFIGPTPGSGDIDAGVNTSNLIVKRFLGSWFTTTIGTTAATSTQATGITGFGAFQLAQLTCTPPVISSPSITNVSCNGSSDGAIDISTTGGTSPFTYAWSNGASTEDITGVPAGTYTLTITATGGCTVSSGNITVTEPAVINAIVNSTDVTCFAANDGTITFSSVTGGSGTYQYTDNGGSSWQASPSFTGLAGGSYNIQIRDAAHTSCVVIFDLALVISAPAVLSASVASTDISCNGSTDGTISITSEAGGYGTYEFTINAGTNWQSSGSFTGLAAGTYNVQIRDAAHTGCIVTLNATLVITAPAVLNASVASSNVDCNGANNGSITITSPSGGFGNYEYSIDGGSNWQSSGSFTGLAAGTHNVQIRDADHITCVVTLNGALNITEPAVLNAVLNSTDASCGVTDGTITFSSPTGGSGTYEYTIDGGTNWQSSGSFTGLAAGSYNAQIRDAAHTTCIVILDNDHILNQASTPGAPTSGGDQTVCADGNPGQTITATATSVATITWYDAATGGNIVSPPSLVGIGTVIYYAEASSGICISATRTAVTLTIQAAPVAPVSGGDETVCSNGDPMQTLIATASSPNTITWYDAATAGNVVTPALIGIGTATFYAEASNGSCVSSTRTAVTLTIRPVLATPGTITGPLDVCPLIGSPTPSIYSIAAVSGATTYIWSVPPGATIVSGQGSTSLGVTFDNSYAFTNQFFRVDAESPTACTSGVSSLEVLKVLPGIPTVINGPTDACPFIGQPTNAVYSIDPVVGATSYTWTVSANMTLVSGQGSLSVEVSFLTGYTSGSIKVQANSNCGARAARSLTVTKVSPAVPAAISGPADACPYIGTAIQVNYTIAAVPNAISYNWSVPAHVTLVSGQGTTSIMVTFNAGYTVSLIRVRSVSNCSTSGYQSLSVGAAVTTIPGVITGPTNACQFIGTGLDGTYTINKVAGANSYIWSVPAGATITTHPGGAGVNDTTVTISYDNSFVSGTDISVQAVSCLASAARTLTVTRILIGQPGLISTVSINVCPYMVSATNPTGTPVVYTIKKTASATSYNWTAPAGATITNHPNGAGVNDTTIEITYSAGFTSGDVTVSASNNCGPGAVRTLGIISLRPGTVAGITTAQTVSCPNRQYTYSVASFPTNGTSILWTVPTGGTILSGQGTLSITVSYTSGAINGTVTATGINNCGSSSSVRTISIKLTACTGRPAGKTTVPAITVPYATESMKLNVFPNPTVSDFKLQVVTADKEAIYVRILDMQGRELKQVTVMPYQTINIGAELKAGSYLVEVTQGKNRTTQKLLKF